MWSSDYPHWDFDLPSSIYDLPFLKETAKRNILGGNAAKLFGLDTKVVKKIPSAPTSLRSRRNDQNRAHATRLPSFWTGAGCVYRLRVLGIRRLSGAADQDHRAVCARWRQ